MHLNISQILQYGDHFRLRMNLHHSIISDLKKFDDKWSQYNPRKPNIKRQGLCVLNERGKTGPGPALDSLKELNSENNILWNESDFDKPTELYYESNALQNLLSDKLTWCIRTHFIRLEPGGFFPPHRDHTRGVQNTFRLIVPIENCNPPDCRFMLEDTSLYWEYFRLYFVNTTKVHTLFNASPTKNSIWLVINAKLCEESIEFIEKYL